METNALPRYDMSENPTDCCPRFRPEPWDEIELHFEDKPFLRAETKSVFHVPLNMRKVFAKTFADIQNAGAFSEDDYVVLSHDPSSWKAEHYFAITREVPGHNTVRLSGDFLTKVFEGPFQNAGKWDREMASYVRSRGREPKKIYFFYTTCPRCAKVYGKNYVVAVSEVEPAHAKS